MVLPNVVQGLKYLLDDILPVYSATQFLKDIRRLPFAKAALED
jgi:hypothetical protein